MESKKSFRNVKENIEDFRKIFNDIVVFLDYKNNELEKRLDKIKAMVERLEEALLRVLILI